MTTVHGARGPLAALAAVLAVAALAGSAPAGESAIKGTVTRGTGAGEPVAGAVVMLEGPTLRAAPEAPHGVIDQRRTTFVPHVLAVQVGTTVDFPNSDPFVHNVSSTSPAQRFDLGMYGQGESRSVTFETPGVVEIRCNVHPKMAAFVVVHANPYFAVTDAGGSYTIDRVPPGGYKVHVWHETLADKRVPVVLREGQVQRLDVRLKRR
jgi:plastocyanin